MVTNNKKTLKISEKLHSYLVKNGGKDDTFEDIIWNLIGVAAVTDEEKKGLKEANPDYLKKL